MTKTKLIPRDISWLGFNGRVLQEAGDPSVPLKERIRFLGIFSNNLDEFFRVRVATLRRMAALDKKDISPAEDPQQVLSDIQVQVLQQQNEFNRIWEEILAELAEKNIFIINDTELHAGQQQFVKKFFEEEVRSNIIPLLPQSNPQFPYLREKSLYLGVVMSRRASAYDQQYALIEVPAKAVGRFVLLPPENGKQFIILLEDVIRFNLPSLFYYFGFEQFAAHTFTVTKDAELDFDTDLSTTLIQKIERGLKNRRKGQPVRFTYDHDMDSGLLEYLVRKLNLSGRDSVIPGGHIHNFRHFMNFPDVLPSRQGRRAPVPHPALADGARITEVVLRKDVLLHMPYHSFNPVIDLLREAAMDPGVEVIKISLYRLASDSKIINALINAARNGKQVVVVLELKARFDEEANLKWKEQLEVEGVKVLVGYQNMKVHAKICLIRKRLGKKVVQYGLIGTGNLNEQTARVYADHCLLTSNRQVMADVNRVFDFLEAPKTDFGLLKGCKTLMVSPTGMRNEITHLINKEIKQARQKKPAAILLKVNSLSDPVLIQHLYEAAAAGVEVRLIIRGIFCPKPEEGKGKGPIRAISIVDGYLEHARVMVFHNGGKPKVYLSSADWMVRNLDHRVEVAVPLPDRELCQELQDLLDLQWQDNVKARLLDGSLCNQHVPANGAPRVRAQAEIYTYLSARASLRKISDVGCRISEPFKKDRLLLLSISP
ncbi:polyphosphate kinase 1 [Paraflavisolibacter sp. H34]|uniref:polyphosphate kinase 1 n=1 Tax=Huijunlia imazamoxiresistens TaxID=3127457 RepID=UPI003016D84C